MSFTPGIESALPLSHTPLQQAIHWLFECWWRLDLKGKEELGWTAFLVCLENTVTLEKPVLEPLYINIKYEVADHLIFYIVDEKCLCCLCMFPGQ